MTDKINKPLRLVYYTDPICSTCWAHSPYLRKLEVEYGHLFELEYRMGGLLESWKTFEDPTGKIKKPQDLVQYWDLLGQKSKMGITGDIWINNPLPSSFPPSLAFHAVKYLKPSKQHQYLRLMRESLFLKDINITEESVLCELAEKVGVDGDAFLKEIKSTENFKRFQKDLNFKENDNIKTLPTFIFINKKGQREVIGYQSSYFQFEAAIERLVDDEIEKSECNFSIYEILKHFGLVSTQEIAVLLNQYYEDVISELNILSKSGFVSSNEYKNTDFWQINNAVVPVESRPRNKYFNVAIVGAGIAGLSAAIYFKNRKINFKVYERFKQMTSRGLGFLLMSNGYEMIGNMGLKQEFNDVSNQITHIKMMDAAGNLLEFKPIEHCYAVSRHDLIKLLTDQLDEGDIVYDKEIVGYQKNNKNRADTVLFRDGEVKHPSLIIASDGVNSTLRNTLFPKYKGEYVKQREIVSSAYYPELSEELGNTFVKIVSTKKGFNMGVLSSGAGNIIWFIQINILRIDEPENNPESLRDFALRISEEVPKKYRNLIQLTDFTRSYLWRTYDMDILPAFHKNGIMLIGDSAHPLLSFTSQGVSSALEDSYILSKLLEDKSQFSNTHELYSYFYKIRKPLINKCISGGRELLDQFLFPEKYEHVDLPFVSYGTK